MCREVFNPYKHDHAFVFVRSKAGMEEQNKGNSAVGASALGELDML